MNDLYKYLRKQAKKSGGPYTEAIINDLSDHFKVQPGEMRERLYELQKSDLIYCQGTHIARQKFGRKISIKTFDENTK